MSRNLTPSSQKTLRLDLERRNCGRQVTHTHQIVSGAGEGEQPTGASSGIDKATALLLAERGAKVVLGARGRDRLKALATRIADAGGEAAYAPTDVKRRDDLSNLVKLAFERYGKLDVLVNKTRRSLCASESEFAWRRGVLERALADGLKSRLSF